MLAAWGASSARFREDANAEEDLVLGGYRDRVVVELAQNAADAAMRAGEGPGRLRLTLTPDDLVVSNTGADLDAAGVESLSTLRASSKRGEDESVGRFGVGFAAVLSVTDSPSIRSRAGAVGWSAARASELANRVPGLAEEIAARAGQVPILRLPFVAQGGPEEGYATTVVLPLRSQAAYDLAHRLLTEIDVSLLLSLPALGEVEVVTPESTRLLVCSRDGDTVSIEDGGVASTWRLVARSGRHDDAALTDRPVEERGRPWWTVTWGVQVRGSAVVPLATGVPRRVHAPTPTDEPLDLPALLVATFPLDPTRRHVAPGAARAAVVRAAAAAYCELVGDLAASGVDAQPLIPGPLAAGALDGELRGAVLELLAATPFLPAAAGGLLAPRGASVLDPSTPELVALLADVVPGLGTATDPRRVEQLGARRLSIADAVDALAGLDREPSWWRTLYASVEPLAADPLVREALGSLPVPLADGRVVGGARGALTGLTALGLEPLGLRIVHPQAAHPLLLRLGAVEASPSSVLADAAVEALVGALADDLAAGALGPEDEVAPVVDAVLALVAQTGSGVAELPWLRHLPLPTAEPGGREEAGQLVLPGSTASQLYDLPRVPDELVRRWGAPTLTAVGVRTDLVVDHEPDVDLAEAGQVDDERYDDAVRGRLPHDAAPPFVVPELVALDLGGIADSRTRELLVHLGTGPLRSVVLNPTRVRLGDGRAVDVPSFAAWQVRHETRLDGRRLDDFRVSVDSRLDGLYDGIDLLGLDQAFLAAVGVRTTIESLLAEQHGADELLERLADPVRQVGDVQLSALYTALARVDAVDVEPPERIRVGPDLVVAAGDVVVADGPYVLALPWPAPPIVVAHDLAEPLADLLDVDLASDRAGGPAEEGERRPVPKVVATVLPGAPTTWREHGELIVDGHEVDWWVTGSGGDAVVHAATLDGLARGLAWAADSWSQRLLVAALLAEPERIEALLAEAAFDSSAR